ncbi:MAG: hypothetical protein HQ486_04825 [Acidimicrobiaceae bacterium]|nr:hypothetical protein [Acidimicrobiaceae bacterium]
MAEVPEHLLKRARERRDALSGASPSTDAAGTTANLPTEAPENKPAASAPVANAPLVSGPPPPPPDSAYVVAAKTRKKIPFWAMATLGLLPLWAFLYLLAVRPQEKTVAGPLAIGAGIYGSCAGCHGADGAGGAGRILYQGEVLKTFPKIEDMLNFVYNGSQQFVSAGLAIYGDPDRTGGPHAPLSFNGNPMPQQGEKHGGGLTETEILGVVCHVRYVISGADPQSQEWKSEYDHWCSPESEIFAGLRTGAVNFDNIAETYTAMPDAPKHVGTDPRP